MTAEQRSDIAKTRGARAGAMICRDVRRDTLQIEGFKVEAMNAARDAAREGAREAVRDSVEPLQREVTAIMAVDADRQRRAAKTKQ